MTGPLTAPAASPAPAAANWKKPRRSIAARPDPLVPIGKPRAHWEAAPDSTPSAQRKFDPRTFVWLGKESAGNRRTGPVAASALQEGHRVIKTEDKQADLLRGR